MIKTKREAMSLAFSQNYINPEDWAIINDAINGFSYSKFYEPANGEEKKTLDNFKCLYLHNEKKQNIDYFDKILYLLDYITSEGVLNNMEKIKKPYSFFLSFFYLLHCVKTLGSKRKKEQLRS